MGLLNSRCPIANLDRDRIASVLFILAVGLPFTRVGDLRADEFQFVVTHPDAQLQETPRGRNLQTLHVHDDKVFIGYGDYGADTGPIHVRYFDPQVQSLSPSLITSKTESIARFATVGDNLFALTTDPLLREPGGYVSLPGGSNEWVEENGLSGLHFFDMTSFNDDSQRLLLAGSGGPSDFSESFVYESLDGGATWQESLVLNSPEPKGENDFTRFYGIGSLNGKAYVQQVSFAPFWEALPVSIYDGETWTEGPLLRTERNAMTRFIDPVTFSDEIVVRDEHSGAALSPLFRFDGESLRKVRNGIVNFKAWDQLVQDDWLYVLSETSEIWATQDFETWRTVVDNVPSNAQSFVISDDGIYVGTDDSSLYRLDNRRCDLDGNWLCDLQDIDLLTGAIFAESNNIDMDLNTDGFVDLLDRDTWLTLAANNTGFDSSHLLGDADLNGVINATDLTILAIGWQSESAGSWSRGDFNADGLIDATDLNFIGRNWQERLDTSEDVRMPTSVPESSSITMVFAAVAGWLFGRRRKQRQRVSFTVD